MKIVRNDKKIERSRKIARYTLWGNIILAVVLVYILWQAPDQFLIFIGGTFAMLILSQISIYYSSRFGRSPRPDELLTNALKGLSDLYTLYHYMTPAPHVLVGPTGVWVLLPYAQPGPITYNPEKKRWKQPSTGLLSRMFGEGLGRPEVDARYAAEDIQRYLAKKLGAENVPPVQGVLIFTAKNVVVQAEGSTVPAMPLEKAKDFFRRKPKEALSVETLQKIEASLSS